jgi:hypothetical protein
MICSNSSETFEMLARKRAIRMEPCSAVRQNDKRDFRKSPDDNTPETSAEIETSLASSSESFEFFCNLHNRLMVEASNSNIDPYSWEELIKTL